MSHSREEFIDNLKVAMVDNSRYATLSGQPMPAGMKAEMVDSMTRLANPIWDLVDSVIHDFNLNLGIGYKVKMTSGDLNPGYLSEKIDGNTIQYNGSSKLYVDHVSAATAVKTGGVRVGSQSYLYMDNEDLKININAVKTFIDDNGLGLPFTWDDTNQRWVFDSKIYFTDDVSAMGGVTAYSGTIQTSWWDDMPLATLSSRGGILLSDDFILDTNDQLRFIGEAGISNLNDFTTDDLAEGVSNLYFTNARAVSAIQADDSWNAGSWNTAYDWGNHAGLYWGIPTGAGATELPFAWDAIDSKWVFTGQIHFSSDLTAAGGISAYAEGASASLWDDMPLATSSKIGGVILGSDFTINTSNELKFIGDVGTVSDWGDIGGTLSNQTDLQSALDAKESSISAGTTSQYYRGDKTWQTLLGTTSSTAYRGDLGNTAYNERRQWDGGPTNLNATTARTSLGLTGTSNTTHYHDSRYYTESEADARFVNVAGDTMTGALTVRGTVTAGKGSTASADGDVLLQLNSDRPWQFKQVGNDSGAQLSLYPVNSGKEFRILNNADGIQFRSTDTYTSLGYSGATKLATTATGVDVTGEIDVTGDGYFGGNVGIGTTAPTLALDVASAGLAAPATSGTVNTGLMRVGYNSRAWAGTELNIGVINGGSYPAWLQAQKPTDLSVTRPLALNPNGGNVGIGTILPTEKLEIKSSGNSTKPLLVTDEVGNQLFRVYQSSVGSGSVTVYDQSAVNKVLINSAGDSYFNGGNVGIGTTIPTEALEVSGNIQISNTSTIAAVTGGVTSLLRFYSRDTSTGSQHYPAAFKVISTDNWGRYHRLGIFTASGETAEAERISIDRSGHVGINETNPTEALEVGGNIVASGDIVAYG